MLQRVGRGDGGGGGRDRNPRGWGRGLERAGSSRGWKTLRPGPGPGPGPPARPQLPRGSRVSDCCPSPLTPGLTGRGTTFEDVLRRAAKDGMDPCWRPTRQVVEGLCNFFFFFSRWGDLCRREVRQTSGVLSRVLLLSDKGGGGVLLSLSPS